MLRRIHETKDFLKAMEEARVKLEMTMEEVCERAGAPDRYYNKVIMGKESEAVRDERRALRGRQKPKGQTTIRFPFRMQFLASCLLEACGMALVVMPLEEAEKLVEPDPVTMLELARKARIQKAAELGEKR